MFAAVLIPLGLLAVFGLGAIFGAGVTELDARRDVPLCELELDN